MGGILRRLRMGKSKEEIVDLIEGFIERNRKICWEAEYQGGEFCIGEDSVREFLTNELMEKT